MPNTIGLLSSIRSEVDALAIDCAFKQFEVLAALARLPAAIGALVDSDRLVPARTNAAATDVPGSNRISFRGEELDETAPRETYIKFVFAYCNSGKIVLALIPRCVLVLLPT